jgi:hypothetical protein
METEPRAKKRGRWFGDERRATNRAAGRSGFDDDAADASFRPLHADEPPPPEAAAPIVLSSISEIAAPAPRGWIARLRNGLAGRWLIASPNLRGSVYMLSSLWFTPSWSAR